MRVTEELHIGKPLGAGHELALSILLTREQLSRVMDERVFKPAGITDQQFNVLRILKGGPAEGYTIGEVRRRVITRNADVPRLVDRLVKLGLVRRLQNTKDRRSCHVLLTTEGDLCQAKVSLIHGALLDEIEEMLPSPSRTQLVNLLEILRDGLRNLGSPEEGN
ncbi:MAG: MarR family transcriptional regulator [Holophaga sp.]|nr:MarR family transcriptional regulator [Holophaga sp.]